MRRIFLVVSISLVFIVSMAFADSVVFQDDFSSGLANWTTGTNTAVNTAPTVGVTGGRVEWTQGWDYIETKADFSGDFRVEVDLARIEGSVACKDFVIEFVGNRSYTGVLRLQYGTTAKDTINLGQGPALDDTNDGWEGVCVEDDTGYKAEMDRVADHTGTATLTYTNGQIKFGFHSTVGTIETPWANAGTMSSTKIRIWATTNSRFVDAVRVYSGSAPPCECSYVDMSNADIVIPCLLIDQDVYSLRLNYDPTITGGYYWKLDLDSIEKIN